MKTALISFVMLAAVFWPLEKLFPSRQGQTWVKRVLGIDTIFFFGQYLVWGALAFTALAFAQPFLSSLLPAAVPLAFRSQPLPLQLVETVVLADLGAYWFHRACHRFEPLWRIHSVHHSATEVDWLAAHREHPLDGLFTQAVINLPVLLLGVPLSVVAGVVAFRGLWAIFVHSNVKLPMGPLRVLFGAPQLHRWHHSREGMGQHNFANLAPYLDKLFGTYHLPEDEHEAWEVGLAEPFPKGYVGQLMHPFPMTRPLLIACGLLAACGGSMMMTGDSGTPADAGTTDAGTTDAGVDAGTPVTSPKLSFVPDCGTPFDGGTAQEIFTDIVMNQGCAAVGCHGPGTFFHYSFNDAASMKAAWVNQPSAELPAMSRVVPFAPEKSYVIAKLTDQQRDAGGSGDQMPLGGPYLSDAELCRVVNWVRAGAP